MFVEYPFLPEGRKIQYVDEDNQFIIAAKTAAKEKSLDKNMPVGVVLVMDGEIIASEGNGSPFHENNICERKRLGIPTGEGYELCEGCHPKNHAETSAINEAISLGKDPKGADVYLWGHWWCCEACWGSMIENEIGNVYLLSESSVLFNKDNPDNIIGKGFDI